MLIGGHLTPALALAQYFQEKGIENLVWVGTRFVQTGANNNSFEYDEVRKLNIPFIELKTGKLWRKWTFKTLLKAIYNLLLIPWGSLHSLFILLRYNPKLIIGFGGYLQVHLMYWGKLLGKSCVIHEQTTVAGTSINPSKTWLIVFSFPGRKQLNISQNLKPYFQEIQLDLSY